MPYNKCPVCQDQGFSPYCSECGMVEETIRDKENARRYCAGLPMLKPGPLKGCTIEIKGVSTDNLVEVLFSRYWNDSMPVIHVMDHTITMSEAIFSKIAKKHGLTLNDFLHKSVEVCENA